MMQAKISAAKRVMSVKQALEWAFGAEKVWLSLGDTGAEDFTREGIDPLWRGMQMAILGCSVDGTSGGPNDHHPDAVEIAAIVETVLPRHTALIVAEYAKAGCSPEWRVDSKRRIVPLGWHLRKDGQWTAETRDMPEETFKDQKYRVKTYTPEACPVRYVGGAETLHRARRAYLDWYGAILEVWSVLQGHDGLASINISRELPSMAPWND